MPIKLNAWISKVRSLKFSTKLFFLVTILSIALTPFWVKEKIYNRNYAFSPGEVSGATENKIYFGSFVSGWHQNNLASVLEFESKIGKGLAIINFFTAWGSEYPNLAIDQLNKIRAHGSIPMITWEPGNTTLEQILNGQHDAYIIKFAQDSKNWGHPYFLRFAHEMNGSWVPWSEQRPPNASGQYAQVWRYIHDIFQREGVTNVTWVWCPNAEGENTTPLEGLYPGDEYVDWTCIDGYNWGGGGWQTFTEVNKSTYDHVLQIAPSKPVMIGETASSEVGGSKGEWITSVLASELNANFPQVKAFLWFNNIQDGQDWRVDSSASSLEAFSNSIASDKYLSNSFSSISASPITAPESYISPTPTPTFTPTPTPTNTPTPTPSPSPTPTPIPTFTPTQTPTPRNILLNSSFDVLSFWPSPWRFAYQGQGAGKIYRDTATRADGSSSSRVDITRASSNSWEVQLLQRNLPLQQSKNYELRFWARADRDRTISVSIQQGSSPWTSYSENNISVAKTWKEYVIRFTAPVFTSNAQVSFNMARSVGKVWIDRTSLK